MVEPLFAPVPQLWPVVPSPAFGFAQSPMASHRLFGAMSAGLPALGPAAGGGLGPVPNTMPGDPYAFAGSGPVATAVPALTTSEIAVGVTASALLTAVAMRRGQPLGPTNDQETEDFISDAFDLLPGTNDVEVRVEGGRATLTGSVPHKRLKRDVGEIAWTIPMLNDVQNNVTITQRRRSRTVREGESPAVAGRKQT